MPKKSLKKQSRLQSFMYLGINTLVWGASLVVAKPAFEVTSPFRYLLYRFIFAALFSLPILLYYLPKIKRKLQAIFKIVGVELVGTTLALSLLYSGLNYTSAIEASFITTTTPIFVVIAGILFLKEKEEPREALGLLIAFLGTLVLTFLPFMLSGESIGELSFTGNMLIIGQNIATASYFILAKKHYSKLPKLFITTISFYVGIVTFLFLSLTEVNFSASQLYTTALSELQNITVLLSVLYMAIFASIIGLTTYIKGQDGIEASEASLFSYLQPLVYVPLGVLVLGEHLHMLQVIALLLIFVGVFVAERKN